MKKFHGKKTAAIITFIVCLMIIVYVLLSHNSTSKSAIISYVQNNKSNLEMYIQAIDTSKGPYTDVYNNWNVAYYQNSGMFQFLVSAGGIGSSSKYSGFYYSPQNIPMGYQEQNIDLQKNESGWQWNEPNGDNHYYTEKITDNWYWFEMDF